MVTTDHAPADPEDPERDSMGVKWGWWVFFAIGMPCVMFLALFLLGESLG
jgi:hypothetical protein